MLKILAMYLHLAHPVSVGIDCDDPHAYTCKASAGGGWTDVSRELIHVEVEYFDQIVSITVPRGALIKSGEKYKPVKFNPDFCGLPMSMWFPRCD